MNRYIVKSGTMIKLLAVLSLLIGALLFSSTSNASTRETSPASNIYTVNTNAAPQVAWYRWHRYHYHHRYHYYRHWHHRYHYRYYR